VKSCGTIAAHPLETVRVLRLESLSNRAWKAAFGCMRPVRQRGWGDNWAPRGQLGDVCTRRPAGIAQLGLAPLAPPVRRAFLRTLRAGDW